MQLKVTKMAAGAIWNALSQHEVKGRKDARKHAGLTRALRSGATKKLVMPDDAPDDQKKQDLFDFVDGVLSIDEVQLDYLECAVDKRLEAGVPGNIGLGYGELVEAIEAARPTK